MVVLAEMIAPTEHNGRTQTRHRESTVGTINQIKSGQVKIKLNQSFQSKDISSQLSSCKSRQSKVRPGAASGVRMVMRVMLSMRFRCIRSDEAETESGNQSTGDTQCTGAQCTGTGAQWRILNVW